MVRVEIAEQVVDFIRGLAPAPKRQLRLAMRGLEQDRGDIKALVGELAGYHRLRVSGYRVIFRRLLLRGEEIIRCDYAERRSVIYSQFQPEA